MDHAALPDFTSHWMGYLCLGVFALAYIFVILEEAVHLRKSKPVIMAAGIIWVFVASIYTQTETKGATEFLRHNLLEYGELLLFLLAAMTYINTLDERQVFQALRARLVSSGLSLRALYWLTGVIAFFLSPIADNLTTALVLGAVVVAVGAGHARFMAVGCINVVVAANAGGAFSPFGDITTLMVWQKGLVAFHEFFVLFVPALVSWIVPAVIMSFAVPVEKPAPIDEKPQVKPGGYMCTCLFLVTIVMTVLMHQFLHLPPVLGMMTGLGLLMIYGYFIQRGEVKAGFDGKKPFDIFISLRHAEWDTLLFFYGVILCVGGLAALGYLGGLSHYLYNDLGPTSANIWIGIISAIVDNIPVMYAVLTMNPEMNHAQWLLVTLTAGIGGSLLSIGSAAGVALMGQARGVYTFMAHLKWTWAIGLGYGLGIYVHIWMNGS